MKRKASFIFFLTLFSLYTVAVHPVWADDRPPLTLDQVLQRHLLAVGGKQAVDSVKSLRFMVASEMGGQKRVRVVTYKAPDKEYIININGIMQGAVGYDGKVGWQRDTNGNIRLLTQDELDDLRGQLDLATHREADASHNAEKITLRPSTERGTGDYILDVAAKDRTTRTRYIDPKTFLLVKEVRTVAGHVVQTTYTQFQSFGGLNFATTEQTTIGKITLTTTLSDVHINVDVSDSDFALPVSAKNYEWLKPGASSAMFPFDYSDQNVGLYVGLNGRPAYVDLDSGTGGMILYTQAVDALKLKPAGDMLGLGYGGFIDEHPVLLELLEIPDAVAFSSLTASSVYLPLSLQISRAVPTAGMIGYDMLSRFVVKVDYADQLVTLFDLDKWTPSKEDGAYFALGLDNDVPSVQVTVDDLTPASFLIDTGDAVSDVMLYADYAKRSKLDEKYPHGYQTAGAGVGGSAFGRRVRVRSVALAGLTFKDVPTDFLLDTHTPPHLAGALGNGFLSRFTVTFDYPHRRVFFAPNPDAGRAFDTRTFGVYVVELPDTWDRKKTHFLISGVAKESPAARARLEAGQELLQVDGKPASDLGLIQIRASLSAAGSQQTHVLYVKKADGRKATFTVSSYDPLP